VLSDLLQHTFRHIKGIGPNREEKLWAAGCHTWQDLLNRLNQDPLSITSAIPSRILPRVKQVITELSQHFSNADLLNLSKHFKPREHWRLYRDFSERAVFVDIETTGLGRESIITVIGTYSPMSGPKTFVEGFNLPSFEAEISQYEIVVTFNGSSFDLPFIRRSFPNLVLPPVHIDLRFLARMLGYTGGLKLIERRLGLVRNDSVAQITGADCVILWSKFQCEEDLESLHLLLRYNLEDTINLEPILTMLINEHSFRHPFLGDPILEPRAPQVSSLNFPEIFAPIHLRH
jgi:uncharacterized protein YprB with RNaseH-like and TPR domain